MPRVFPLSLLLFLLIALPNAAQFEAPLQGPIVASTPGTQDRILLHDIGSGEVRSLDFGEGEFHVWDFSPDGCRVLFTRDIGRSGLPRLYSAALDGGDLREMVSFDELPADQWGVWEPDWSAQGQIAFTMIRLGTDPRTGEELRETHIGIVDAENPSPTFYSVTGREYTPVWSADGAWLAYVSYDERLAGLDPQSTAVPTSEPAAGQSAPDLPTLLEADLWAVSADGETKYRLTGFPVGSVRHPRWSPDGELIGFVYSPSPANDTLWMIANNSAAQPTQLNFVWQLTLDHTWLPDSSAMLASMRNFRDVDQNRLWKIPLVGNADNNDASLYLPDDSFTYTDYPRFSADGRYLALRSDYHLIVYDTQAATWERLDVDAPGNTPPVWSPAGFSGETGCE